MAEKRCIVLTSSCPSTLLIEQNQRRMIDALASRKIKVETVDGSNAENLEMRNKMFGVSGKRAVYPQCFFEENGELEFVVDWDAMEQLLECEDIPAEVLSANPDIKTFNEVFASAPKM